MEFILSLLYIFCSVSLLNSEKGVRIKQLTDVGTIILQTHDFKLIPSVTVLGKFIDFLKVD